MDIDRILPYWYDDLKNDEVGLIWIVVSWVWMED